MTDYNKIIDQGENSKVEFKSTLRFDIRMNKTQPHIEQGVLKTLAAFLNSQGGILLIGIDDSKNILGLDYDFKTFSASDKQDEFLKHFDNLFRVVGDKYHRNINVVFPKIEDKKICAVHVTRSNEPVFIAYKNEEEQFYVRRAASSVKLGLKDTVTYITEHFQRKALNPVEFEKLFESKESFRTEFSKYLTNNASDYYQEIKAHWNTNHLLEDSPFLSAILVDNIELSVDYGILPIMSDFIKLHIQNAKEEKHLYNQEYVDLHYSEDRNLHLPLYYHLQFLSLLHITAIQNKFSFGSSRKSLNGHMYTIFSEIIKSIIRNMEYRKGEPEIKTNFHELIKTVFHSINIQLETFAGEFSNFAYYNVKPFQEEKRQKTSPSNYSQQSSFFNFLPVCTSYCLSELYTGLDENKLSIAFVSSIVYYDILTFYFENDVEAEFLNKFENEIISKIPKNILPEILDFSLDEKFAITYEEFKKKRFGFCQEHETKTLLRLWNILYN